MIVPGAQPRKTDSGEAISHAFPYLDTSSELAALLMNLARGSACGHLSFYDAMLASAERP
jgi:hypothetical protein